MLSADHMLQQIVVRDATLAEMKKGEKARERFVDSIVKRLGKEEWSDD